MKIELNDAYAIIAYEGSEFEPTEKAIDVIDVPSEVLENPLEWYYYKGEFYHEIPDEVVKELVVRGEEERAEYERTRPKTTEEKVDELTAITDDMILLMAELIGG